MKSRVIILKSDYSRAGLEKAFKRGIDLLGGLASLFAPGEKILVKPNMLSPDPPAKAVNTHPEVLAALFAFLQREGYKLEFGDSPGLTGPLFTGRKNGILDVAREFGVPLADFESALPFKTKPASFLPTYDLAAALAGKPALVSVSKMKNHGFMRITGAIKNHFGLIPGLKKGEFHLRLRTRRQFAKMLADLHLAYPARLYIMDGIDAMEGGGPRSGTPRRMGVLLMSTDPVALDSTFCRLIDYPPNDISAIAAGFEAGLGQFELDMIDHDGDNWRELAQPEYRIERTLLGDENEVKYPEFVRNRVAPRPFLITENCRSCKECFGICPAQPRAIEWKNSKPVFLYKNCIHCLCCQEICPHAAIGVKRPLLHRLLFRKKGK